MNITFSEDNLGAADVVVALQEMGPVEYVYAGQSFGKHGRYKIPIRRQGELAKRV